MTENPMSIHTVLRDMGVVLSPLMREVHTAEPLFRLHSGRTAFKLEVTWTYEKATQISQPPSSELVIQKSGRRRRRPRRRQTTAKQQQQQKELAAARSPENVEEPMEAGSAPGPGPPTGPPPGFVAPAGEGWPTSSRLGRPAPPVSPHPGAAARHKEKNIGTLNQPLTQAGPEMEEMKKKES